MIVLLTSCNLKLSDGCERSELFDLGPGGGGHNWSENCGCGLGVALAPGTYPGSVGSQGFHG